MTNKPRTSSRASRAIQRNAIEKNSSIATVRPRQRDNNDKLQNDPSYSGSASNRIAENTELGIHTGNATRWDDVVETGVKHRYPSQFESVSDRSDRVPAWQQVGRNMSDPHAVTRTAPEGRVVGYSGHKAPISHTYTEAECHAISSGGVTDYKTHMPTHLADGNRY
jgi:hypothetical protein